MKRMKISTYLLLVKGRNVVNEVKEKEKQGI